MVFKQYKTLEHVITILNRHNDQASVDRDEIFEKFIFQQELCKGAPMLVGFTCRQRGHYSENIIIALRIVSPDLQLSLFMIRK